MYAEDSGSSLEPVVHGGEMRPVSREGLRAMVCEWTWTLKVSGLPPEKALVAVKTFVKQAIAPQIIRYSDADLVDDHLALIAEASQWCIEAYFDSSSAQTVRGDAKRTANTVARKSLSRQLLLKLFNMRPELPRDVLASRLSVELDQLSMYESGAQLMPYDVQESLAALVLECEPRLARFAHQLRLQLQAARRYEAGEVVRHLTSPPRIWR